MSAEDVAVFMHYRFDVEQESAKELVQSHVRSARQAAADPTRVLTAQPNPQTASGGGDGSGVSVASRTAPMEPEAPRRSRARSLILVSGGIVLIAMWAIAGMMRAGSRSASLDDPPGRATTSQNAPPPMCEQGFKGCEGGCVSIDRPDRGCGAEACHACTILNATPRCNRSHACDIAVCYSGFQDCNGDARDGCETNVRTDPDNCGACGRKCPPLPYAERGCGDACTIWRCEPGHRDCNGVVADGCEVNALHDAANCGACGHACAAGKTCKEGACK